MRPQGVDWAQPRELPFTETEEQRETRRTLKRQQLLSLVDSAGAGAFVQEQKKDVPPIDFDAWLNRTPPAEHDLLIALREELRQVIVDSRTPETSGQWTRLEREHGRLRARHPSSGWANAVATGLKYTLRSMPPQTWLPPARTDELSHRVLDTCMASWFDAKIAIPIPASKLSEAEAGSRTLRYLPIFVLKKPGKPQYEIFDKTSVLSMWRPCLNGKSLNDTLIHGYYKQHSTRELDALSEKDDWTIKLDAHSAFQILQMSEDPIDQARFGLTSSTDLMCFKLPPDLAAKHKCPHGAQVVVNTFGMAPAPLFFNKPKRLIAQEIKAMGIRMGVVMDDDSINAPTPLLCLQHALIVAKLYAHYGVPLSSKDAERDTTPTREKEINGMLYAHYLRCKFWPQRKADACIRQLRRVLKRNRKGRIRATEMASLLGRLESAAQGLFGVKLFLDGLTVDLRTTLNSTWPQSFSNYGKLLPHTVQQLRHLLMDEFHSLQGRQMIYGEKIDYQLQTDWCPYGYGVVVPPNQHSTEWLSISVPLGKEWRKVWSGAGETWAGMMGVMAAALHQRWSNGIINLQMDNVAAVLYINRMAARQQEVNEDLHTLRVFLRALDLIILASWTPGALILADAPSRKSCSIWDGELHPKLFQQLEWQLLTKWRGLHATFDLFATHLNRKVPRFGSLYPNPQSTWVNSMARTWTPTPPMAPEIFYAFPPQILLLMFLSKLKAEQQTALLITHVSPQSPIAQIAELMIEPPIIFPWTDETVINPHLDMLSPNQLPYQSGHWVLAGVLISGNALLRDPARTTRLTRGLKMSKAPSLQSLNGFGLSSQHTAKALEWTSALHNQMKRCRPLRASLLHARPPATKSPSGARPETSSHVGSRSHFREW
jgi:hypothetical protein